MNKSGRRLMLSALSLTMALSLLATPYSSSSTAYALDESAARSSTKTAQANELANKQQAPHIQYDIQATLHAQDRLITATQKVKYRNQSKDKLDQVVFRLFADSNRSKDTQTAMFKKNNELIAKENPAMKPEDFLGGIDIQEVKDASTGQALAFKNENQALTVELPKGLDSNSEITLEMKYKTKIPFGMQRLSEYKDLVNGAHWFPVASVYNDATHSWAKEPYSTHFETDYYDVADYKVSLNVPENMVVAMPGDLTETKTGDGRKMVTAKADNTRELVFFASENFKKASKTKNGRTVEYFYLNEKNDPKKDQVVQQYLDHVLHVLDFFSEKFGPYGYPEFRVVESYVQGVAVEFSRLVQMGPIQASSNPADDSVLVHEIAHQWFHSMIGNDSENESFLDEGFADFAMSYFYEKEGSKLNGFNAIRLPNGPVDQKINSTNTESVDMSNLLFYQKGRQAIYELYCTVGESKFDAFMKEYFNRYAYKNATVEGLLQTIEDQLGIEARDLMDKNLNQPNYDLNPKYAMTEQEMQEYMKLITTQLYDNILSGFTDLPKYTMVNVMEKAIHGEPVVIVLADGVSKQAHKQQQIVLEGLNNMFSSIDVKPLVLSERQAVKKELESMLAKSNVIAIGNPNKNAFVQALKPQMVKKASEAKFPWKEMMKQSNVYGAYGVVHPYNKDRLVVHYFWTGDQASAKGEAQFLPMAAYKTMGATNNLYQYMVYKADGTVIKEQYTYNPISELFAE